MAFFDRKPQNTQAADPIPKTEPAVSGGIPYTSFDSVPPTMPADNGYPVSPVVDFPDDFFKGTEKAADSQVSSSTIVPDDYRPTEPASAVKNPLYNSDSNNFVEIRTTDIGARQGEYLLPVVGWLVCTKGPDFGKDFRIHSDYNRLGSMEGDIIVPGDKKISKRNHMRISYEPRKRTFSVSPFEGSNYIYLNNEPLEGAARLKNFDVIATGDTELTFIAFCGENFSWD